MNRPAPTSYSIAKLNQFSDESWAVVEAPSGAIALDLQGRFIFRLTKAVAREIERAMTARLEDAGTDPVTDRRAAS